MSNHTPGPWKNDGRKLITTVGIVISKDKSLGPIAVVSEENAPLVLAAPEMYEALKEAKAELFAAKMREATDWGAGLEKAMEFANEHPIVHKISTLLSKLEGAK
jgi:hypothetical protein